MPGQCNCEAFPIVQQVHLLRMASGEIQGLNQDVTGRLRWVLLMVLKCFSTETSDPCALGMLCSPPHHCWQRLFHKLSV